ncbi:efflux RND transporter periplasmic adaptor subunit [Oscillatoria sp. CS-180]|uniref:efflux RND transporter periplasmic adaptor subunit n=1 Tax=Oscillatoria sp. CS-180 TaxID=3021720 RepID=UPI0023305475|nr:efflux RND transporter periplasmic adaptor subunit [Oscillatoria sp. CS-180]MDB9529521.1 efflux RND transporter periplasmic adaptor subunit [Oscillatoria sp. CS-180]
MAFNPDTLPPIAPSTTNPNTLKSPLAQRSWRKFLWVPLAIAPLLVGVYYFRSAAVDEAVSEAGNAALPVTVVSAERVEGYEVEREYTGELVAGRSSVLGFERTGTVVEVLVDEGDRVVVSQPLARLDNRTLAAQRQQVEAQRQEAIAQLQELQAGPRLEDIAAARAAVAELEQQVALSRLQRDRREDLYAQGAISLEALDQETYSTSALEKRLAQAESELLELETGTRREQLDAQAARVSQLDAQLQQIDVDLEKSVLYAPFDGTISVRSLDEGVVAGSGQAVLSLVEAGSLEARVGIPPEIANTLTLGSEQTVRMGDRTYTASVTALLPELDDISRTVTAVLRVPVVDLTVGQTVRLVLAETQATSGFWLPTTALVPGERGLWSAYVLGDSPDASSKADSVRSAPIYTVERRELEVIHTEGDRALVRGTLQPGERVVMSGTHRIVPNQTVQVE